MAKANAITGATIYLEAGASPAGGLPAGVRTVGPGTVMVVEPAVEVLPPIRRPMASDPKAAWLEYAAVYGPYPAAELATWTKDRLMTIRAGGRT